MKWDDEVRSPKTLTPKPVDITDEVIERATLLIDSMTVDDITGQDWATDRYTAALEDVIHAKADGKKPPRAAEEEPAGTVVDLMAALEQSVQKAQESRGEGEHATVHEMKPKRAAKKAAAKKTTTKKTPARKTTAKKRGA
ncbi:hypothetical protein ADL30_20365 [Streptomyces sp. NRRL S-1521]|nr:hypothetical protein ADL30_20365 [Streptomyces sp. NRRL S-1521]